MPTRFVDLPGRATRFDYEAIDAEAHRLWIAHLGDSTVVAVDIDTLAVVAEVADVAGAHGVAVAPARHLVYATATTSNEVVAIDSVTFAIVRRGATGAFPDGVAYDAVHDLVLVTNKSDGTITVHDPDTLAVVRTFKLGDETGNVVSDPTTGLAYAAALPPNRLVTFDPTLDDVISTVELTGCDGAHGVVVPPGAARAYVACENNAKLIIVDLLTAGTVLAATDVASNPDVLAYDPGTAHLFVGSESSNLDRFDVSGARPVDLGRQKIDGGAHVVAVDPVSHRLFVPLASASGGPKLAVITPG